MNWGGWKRYVLMVGAAAVTLAVFGLLYGWLPWWIDGTRLRTLSPKDQAGILGSDRGDVLKMVAGAGALVALVYTARKHALDRKVHALTEQGQVTDRYTKAITQLASDKESERIGGIYALERIMADSARDHPTVVEVLGAFVRQRAALPATEPNSTESGAPHPMADVQAAMTVLARRPQRGEPFALDLRRTKLAGLELPRQARLAGANLAGADLTGADLGEATLTTANLMGATLIDADLGGAILSRADLTGATLSEAYLVGATLIAATLFNATMNEVNLNGANLSGSDLSEATLTETSLHAATLIDADLRDAMLTGANLIRATLTKADLSHATLVGTVLGDATLTGANLIGATLTGANLSGAMLTGVQGISAAQLADALLTEWTKLDEALTQHAWVLARIEACKNWVETGEAPPPTPDPSGAAPVPNS
jgi:uncharacterized protein YjbI with pentapeptide repeats